MRSLLALAALLSSPSAVLAFEVPPVTEELTKTECSACHMAYPAGLLPARSWQLIMSDLPHHFGEDASLAPDVTGKIAEYLVANAADAGGKNNRAMRQVSPNFTPARITEMPFFQRNHGTFSPRVLAKVKAPGNCVACHAGAVQGQFEDD